MLLTYDEAVDRYGAISAGIWRDAKKHCEIITVPFLVSRNLVNSYTGASTSKIYCNMDMSAVLLKAFRNIIDRGLTDELQTFDGCWNIRDVRGEPGKPSAHSYALAIDINAKTNPLGQFGLMSSALASCFTDEGFTHGRWFSRTDPMHFSYAWE